MEFLYFLSDYRLQWWHPVLLFPVLFALAVWAGAWSSYNRHNQPMSFRRNVGWSLTFLWIAIFIIPFTLANGMPREEWYSMIMLWVCQNFFLYLVYAGSWHMRRSKSKHRPVYLG